MPKPRWTIRSFEGVGPVKFGMARGEVRQAMGGEVREFRKAPESVTLSDYFVRHEAVAFYDPDDRLEAIEFSDAALLEWSGIALSGRPVKAMFEDIRSHSSLAEINSDGVTFHDLGIGFWLPGWREKEYESDPPQSIIAFNRTHYGQWLAEYKPVLQNP